MARDTGMRLRAALESLLCAHGAPLSAERAAEVIGDVTRAEVVRALATLRVEYERDGRGFRIVETAGGYQLRTAPAHAEIVRRLFRDRSFRLTRAMLETLAIIAYRQVVTKAEIEAIRGVDVDSALGTLLERRLIRVAGRKDAPGRPLLYATSHEFLEVFGLTTLADLPTLKEIADLGIRTTPEIDFGVGAGTVARGSDPPADALRLDRGDATPVGTGEDGDRVASVDTGDSTA